MMSQKIIAGFVLFLLLLGTASLLVSLTLNGANGPQGKPGPTGTKGPDYVGVLDIKDGGTNASLTVAANKIVVSSSNAFQEGTSAVDPSFDTVRLQQKTMMFGNASTQTSIQFNQSGVVSLNDSKTSPSSLVLTQEGQTINGETTFSELLDLKSLDTNGGVGVKGLSKADGGTVQSEGQEIQVINTSAVGNSYLKFEDASQSSFLKQESTGVFKLESRSHLFLTENRPTFQVSRIGSLDFFKLGDQILFGTNVSLSAEKSNRNLIYSLGKGITTSDVLLTQGNQTIPGTKSFSDMGPIQNIQLTSNQLILGDLTQKVTVNSLPKATDLVVTIPAAIPTSSFVLTEGNQTINGQKTFSSFISNLTNIIISTSSNQIRMGTGQTMTINASPTTTSVIQTLPDVGVNSDFLMTEGTQVIPTAIKTFTNAKFITFQTNTIDIPGILTSLSGAIRLGFPNVTTVQLASGFATGTNYSLDTTIPGPSEFVMSFTSSPGTPQTVGGIKQFTDDCFLGSSLTVNTANVGGIITSTGIPRTYTLLTTSLQTIPNATIDVIWNSGSGTNWSTKTFPLTILTVDITGYYIVEYQIEVTAVGAGSGVIDAWVRQDTNPTQMGRQSMMIDAASEGILSGACIVQVTNVATQGIFIQAAQQTNSLGNNIIRSYCKVTFQAPL